MGIESSKTHLGTMELYHMTGESGKDAIIRSGRMLRGESGAFGGGIYFAATPSDCLRKAKSQGFLVRAEVRMGTALQVAKFKDRSHGSLRDRGCDSVYAPSILSSGPEYVVYNHDQVKLIDIKNVNTGEVVWTSQCVYVPRAVQREEAAVLPPFRIGERAQCVYNTGDLVDASNAIHGPVRLSIFTIIVIARAFLLLLPLLLLL